MSEVLKGEFEYTIFHIMYNLSQHNPDTTAGTYSYSQRNSETFVLPS